MKGWRTFTINAALAIAPLAEIIGALGNMPELRGLVPAEWLPWYAFGVALVNLYLRSITTTPPGKAQ